MEDLLTRSQVLAAIAPLAETEVRTVDHGPNTKVLVAEDGAVALKPGRSMRRLEVLDEGITSLVKFVGIPDTMRKTLRPQTFQRVANEMLERRGEYSVLHRKGEVVEFAPVGKYAAVKPARVLDAIERAIPESRFGRALIMPKQTLHLEVVGVEQAEAGYGDIIRGGTIVDFSPIGVTQPLIQSFVYRMWCRNGCTSNRFFGEFQGPIHGEGDNVWQWFRKNIRASYSQLEHIVERWRQMKDEGIPAEQRAAILEALMKEAGLPLDVQDAVRARALQLPPANNYDMSQLITWASSHILDAPQHIRRAQKASADFDDVQTHSRVCPFCHRSGVQAAAA